MRTRGNKLVVSCLCLVALVAVGGCQIGGGSNWNNDGQKFDLERYVPHVTLIAKAVAINLLKEKDREVIELTGELAGVVSESLRGEASIDPNLAQQFVRDLVEQNAPAVAADAGIMSMVDVVVAIAVGQVQDLLNKYGSQVDINIVTAKLLIAALDGVKDGTDALLLPGGPPPIGAPG